uniref:Uncharacterized protein n=1 Tax=Anguilla anguilla TaxID=7936 RepID=A0A0E9T8P5_ANGAN
MAKCKQLFGLNGWPLGNFLLYLGCPSSLCGCPQATGQ